MRKYESTELGSVLKERRLALRLTQRQLAARLGVSAAHVAYVEHGRRRPSPDLMGRIEKVLSVSRGDLFALAHPVDQPARSGLEIEWLRLASSRKFLKQNAVTPSEIRAFQELSKLGFVPSRREFLAILALIRGPRDGIA